MNTEHSLNSFQELVEALNLKSKYVELVEDNKISVPKRYKELNYETAQWCIDKLHVFNKKSKAIDDIEQVCFSFIDLSSYISLSNIFKQHETGVLDAPSA